MKYIRTEDGIHEIYIDDLDLNEETSVVIAGFRAKYCRGFGRPITKDDILKIADTIEELCDAVLFVEENEFPVFVNREFKEEKGKKLTECYLNIGGWRTTFPSYHKNHAKGVIYGAIWTDKGLIYVAKLNEEGELELL